MGGAVSAGDDNDDLIDNLVEAGYIKSPRVESVFRAVDRADYYLDEYRENAYKDLAWKHRNLHLSAPCIYSEVMESLNLRPGLSFLNLGSGTGYLNTMAGLILGPHGVNHGVELHADVVDYANQKLEDFIYKSHAVDEFPFCVPKFVVGNCLLFSSGCRLYDRVYCGAGCPVEAEAYMKNLISFPDGILVMPLNEHLLQIKRTGETKWDVNSVLPVSFASLILPSASNRLLTVAQPECHPMSLQESCRVTIRRVLCASLDTERPHLRHQRYRQPRKKTKKRRVRNIVIPIFEESDDLGHNGGGVGEGEGGGGGGGRDLDMERALTGAHRRATHQLSAAIGEALRQTRSLATSTNATTNGGAANNNNGVHRRFGCATISINGSQLRFRSPAPPRRGSDESSSRASSVPDLWSDDEDTEMPANEEDNEPDETGERPLSDRERHDRASLSSASSVEMAEVMPRSASSPTDHAGEEVDHDAEASTSSQASTTTTSDDDGVASVDDDGGLTCGDYQTRVSQRLSTMRRQVIWRRNNFEMESDGNDPDTSNSVGGSGGRKCSRAASDGDDEEDGVGASVEPRGTYGTLLRRKIAQLPLPASLKGFVDFYRKSDF